MACVEFILRYIILLLILIYPRF